MVVPTASQPLPVRIAIGVLAAEAVALVSFSGWMIARRVDDDPSNEQVFEGSAVYLVLAGLLVGLVALALRSGRGWAYGAAVVVQLLALGISYEMARGGFWVGAAPLALGAVTLLVALFTKPARAAFGRDQSAAGD